MAKPNSNHLAAVLLVMFLLFISQPPSSSARLLKGFSLTATEPTLNLALPTDGVVVEKEEVPAIRHLSAPCDHHHMVGVAGKLPLPGTSLTGGKYGPLILNMLPKGSVPPSGPSKRGNNINN